MNKIQDTTYEPQDVLGLITGEGRLPFFVAGGAKRAGLRVICVGLAETVDRNLADEVDVFYRVVIAVEAIEGTAAMIERAGMLCRSGGWTLVKVSKPQRDMRFDVPCVGPDTIRSLVENGGKYLVVEAEKTIVIDKPDTIKLANKLGITILGR